jgi:hypothetical protein
MKYYTLIFIENRINCLTMLLKLKYATERNMILRKCFAGLFLIFND